MSPYPSNQSWSIWRGDAKLAPFSRPHWLTWSQESGQQVGVPRREEAVAAAAVSEAVAVTAAAVAAAAKN